MDRHFKNTITRRTLRGAFVALLFAVFQLSALPASAQQFVYHGKDATYPNIDMDLRITRTAGPWDVTGSIYVGSYSYSIKGTLSGSSLSGNAMSIGVRAFYSAPVSGVLSGNLGSGPLTVTTGPLAFNGAPIPLRFVLTPTGPVAAATPAPAQPAPLQRTRLTGVTNFGYTRVTLTLDLVPQGSSFQVSGTIFVNQIQPTSIQRTLQVSGVLTPGVQGALNVFGAGPQDRPGFTATLGSQGASLQGLMGGMPSLSITRLFVGASR